MENAIPFTFTVADVYEKIVADYRAGTIAKRERRSPKAEKAALLRDVRATFPLVAIDQRYVDRRSPGRELAWMIAAPEEAATMADGLPMFCHWHFRDENSYNDDGWHLAFDRWLELRGWYLERYDEVWFEPAALPTDEERAQWAAERTAYEKATQGPQLPVHLDVPF